MQSQAQINESRLKCARAYVQAGFYLFPLKGKRPKWKGWTKKDYDANLDVKALGSNYGVRLTDDYLVVDIDPRNYIAGIDSLAVLNKTLRIPDLLKVPTYQVQSRPASQDTPACCHVYFKKPANVKVKRNVKQLPGIEIKSKGQYVVGAYSIHPETKKPYTIRHGWVGEIADAPPALLRFIETEDIQLKGEASYDDSSANRSRFINFLEQIDPAIEGEGGDTRTFAVACEGRDYGLSESVCIDILAEFYNPRCEPPWDYEELQVKVQNAYLYGQNTIGSRNVDEFQALAPDKPPKTFDALMAWDRIKRSPHDFANTLANVVLMFASEEFNGKPNPIQHSLRFNKFSETVEHSKPKPWHLNTTLKWDDADTSAFRAFLSNYKINVSKDIIIDAIQAYARRFPYHPVKDWLNSLIWDHMPRLDTMLVDYAGVNDLPIAREFSKCTILGAVARIFEPGCQFDTMLVLEGDQGIGKTNFVRALGGDWYSSIHLDPKNKDTVQSMFGYWFLEVSEMAFLTNKEIEHVKRFIGNPFDNIRLPYGRITQAYSRQSVFIGTINPSAGGEYLSDPTGNRRFWPIKCNKFDIPGLIENRDQIFAEAVYRFKRGEAYHIKDIGLLRDAEREQKKREQQDTWLEFIREWLSKPDSPRKFTIKDVAYDALNIRPDNCKKTDRNRIANALRELKYKECQYRDRGFKQRGWSKDLSDLWEDL